ncbi:MAG TPA: mercuric reductase [Candidatus Binataceae bacterium]|nr:mercuric reductase [Candidatus Binataceae bacterium]
MGHEAMAIAPLDEHNLRLLSRVKPEGWKNPSPAPRYNMVVIGAGTAGLVTAAGAAGLGAKVALIERDLMGGDCLNFGCVPSKALIASSRVLASARNAKRFGVIVPDGVRADFPAVMERMRAIRADLSTLDSAARFKDTLGVDVFRGDARFTGRDTVEVAGARLRFSRATIATGARATAPPIPGLAETGYLTNETVFSLTELPRRLVVIGAGPIGCELAQAFQRLGSAVTMLEVAPQILIREDLDAAKLIETALTRDGIRLVTDCKIQRAEKRGTEKVLIVRHHNGAEEIPADEILIGAGRAPAIDGLNLEAAGVEYDRAAGVKVNDYLQTSNPHIYAIGDAASPYKFTHIADEQARIAIRNALFFGRAKASALIIPWCTYTDPEIAHVGMYQHEAEKRGLKVATFTQPLSDVDRAVLEGETDGFVKVHVEAGSDKILGATIVASHAGDLISEITTAMKAGMGLGGIANVIHPYPTQAAAIKKAGDAYNRTRLTPFAKRLFTRWFSWTR